MKNFHTQNAEEIIANLGTDSSKGLNAAQVEERLKIHGENALPKGDKKSLVRLFLGQFHSRLTYILFGAAGISVAAGEQNDAYGILIAVLIDAVFGFVQERRAENAIEKLQEMVKHEVSVLRDGVLHRVSTEAIVPGDIVILDEGDKVPADCRIVTSRDLRTNESALTGESSTVRKSVDIVDADAVLADMTNMVWMGTSVAAGTAKVVVIGTGADTAFGGIATSLKNIEEERSPLEQRMDVLGQRLGIISIVLSALVFVIGTIQGVPLREMFFFAVAMVVSVIPEGLPAVLALVLAIGVFRMAKKNTIIRHVPSVETLGVTDIICTDKTGTLTENKMTVRQLFMADHAYKVTGEGWEPKGDFLLDEKKIRPIEHEHLNLLLKVMAMCNKATLVRENDRASVIGEPTEGALVVAAAKAGLDKHDLLTEFRIIDEIPFSSSRKYRAMLVEGKDIHGEVSRHIFAVGAYEVLGERSSVCWVEGERRELTDDIRGRFDAGSDSMAKSALRIIAITYKHASDDATAISENDLEELNLLGLVGMMDPPREAVASAIADCRAAGVRVIMVTGDQRVTATAIAREVGLLGDNEDMHGKVFSGAEVAAMDDIAFDEALNTAVIFARVAPDTKLRIVNALEERGHTVAMTGDGVNDAPALKRASIGIAMGITGTDVSKEVADMVLADDNFVSIVSAIEEGRIIFRNVKQTVAYLFMTNIGEVVTVLASMMLSLPLPILPAQILWMNLVTDGFPDVALATEKGHGDVLSSTPRTRKAPVLTKNIFLLTAVTASVMAFGTLALFMHFLASSGLDHARSIAFTTMALFQLWNVFNMRSLHASLFKLGLFTNMWVFWAVVASVLLQVAVLYVPAMQKVFKTVPLSLSEWGIMILVSSSVFFIVEAYKVLVRRRVIPESWL